MAAQNHPAHQSTPMFHSFEASEEQPLENKWMYTFDTQNFYQLKSASQIMDLIQGLQRDAFLTVENVQDPSRFTQCKRQDSGFMAEAAMPHQLTGFGDSPERLVVSMATCYQIMSHYVTTNGSAPAFESLYTFPIETY
ncbi:hypothetical protein QP868_09385 [Brevibacterium sp. UMB1308A]|uniref:hypothetical protein n=1 Tax=Brevibacterium sp. UMB1308A TaxID=3050608 RepID=UPI00254A86C5|nr:hypothetical protein [Brevibacterium sp. UMB1308A]MDK8346764.1 hypothetical protein [Brevibacterium sp. UMB1308B]MDK8714104.1 hypothetical protein [Brevibacterium sp. UMB1308A]